MRVRAAAAALLERIVGAAQAIRSARLLGSMLVAGTHHAIVTWLGGTSGVTRDELVDLVVGIGVDAVERMRRDPSVGASG